VIISGLISLLQVLPPVNDRFWPWFFGGGILWGIIGLLIASTKGRSGWGCCLGCLLGPFGLLLTLLMPDDRG
jgi:hypothetical protein